ncbi:MAG: hypothetical protein ACD_2C00225G0002 [uncultured bacterium (gcode 4)]|uniref:Uncharacterized protein n=1 Tax=uncultured bacterium (gcode 4) TaxID=1234023 RepID=K2GFM9_9BACT|nr:MAG: hypothetical protein ACD_2C00225G0002 [uncultured bacterium (gcode 4)]
MLLKLNSVKKRNKRVNTDYFLHPSIENHHAELKFVWEALWKQSINHSTINQSRQIEPQDALSKLAFSSRRQKGGKPD